MKRIFSTMILAAIAAMSFVSCQDDPKKDEPYDDTVAVTEVKLDQKTLSFTVGDAAVTLKATVLPDNATDKTVTWATNNDAVAIVADGVVTPKAAGVAVITATAGDKSAKCNVTVADAVVAVTGIEISANELKLGIGATEKLEAFVEPADADNPIVEWESDNEAVATVDDAGNVKGIAEGTATITATTNDGGFTATCSVVVEAATISLSADMISTSAPMQFVCLKQGYDHEDGMGGSPDWIAAWAFEGGDWEEMMANREARYALAENLWDDDPNTSFMTNLDYWSAQSSWGVAGDRTVAYHYVQVSFETPVKSMKLYLQNASKYAYFRNSVGFNVYTSTDGENFNKTADSPYFTEGGIADTDGANAECTIEEIADELGIRAIRFDANGKSVGGEDGDWTGNGAAFGIAELKIWRLQ